MELATKLATTVRTTLKGVGTVREIKMFGGIGFMLNGNLLAAASKRGLLARVGKDQQGAALKCTGVQILVMRGRAMQDYIYIKLPLLSVPVARKLLKLAVHFVGALPQKAPKRKSILRQKSVSEVPRPRETRK